MMQPHVLAIEPGGCSFINCQVWGGEVTPTGRRAVGEMERGADSLHLGLSPPIYRPQRTGVEYNSRARMACRYRQELYLPQYMYTLNW